MCELTLKIKSPYNITLFIDGEVHNCNDKGICEVEINPSIEHNMKIYIKRDISKKYFAQKSRTKKKESYNKKKIIDEFYDLVYESKFLIVKNSRVANISFEYRKEEIKYTEKIYLKIPFLYVLKSAKINIFYKNKTIFKNRIDLLVYFIKQFWAFVLIITAPALSGLLEIPFYIINHINNVYFDKYFYDVAFRLNFANSYLELAIQEFIYAVFGLTILFFTLYPNYKKLWKLNFNAGNK